MSPWKSPCIPLHWFLRHHTQPVAHLLLSSKACGCLFHRPAPPSTRLPSPSPCPSPSSSPSSSCGGCGCRGGCRGICLWCWSGSGGAGGCGCNGGSLWVIGRDLGLRGSRGLGLGGRAWGGSSRFGVGDFGRECGLEIWVLAQQLFNSDGADVGLDG